MWSPVNTHCYGRRVCQLHSRRDHCCVIHASAKYFGSGCLGPKEESFDPDPTYAPPVTPRTARRKGLGQTWGKREEIESLAGLRERCSGHQCVHKGVALPFWWVWH